MKNCRRSFQVFRIGKRLNPNQSSGKDQDAKCNDDVLPRLTLNDVPARALLMQPSDLSEENIKAFDILTNNVFRLKLAFPLSELDEQELKLLPIWCEFITQLGAGKRQL